jgi:hypothetical protein
VTFANAISTEVVEQGSPSALPNEPRAFVDSLYEQVVARHPIGVPYGADMKVFRPYFSKTLLRRFALSDSCFNDYIRQRKDPTEKPPILEKDIFSGGADRSEPKNYLIERVEMEKDGSTRVYVRFTWEDPSSPDVDIWFVALVLVREHVRLVVNDVIYLNDQHGAVESTLWRDISLGCIGAHWVGG